MLFVVSHIALSQGIINNGGLLLISSGSNVFMTNSGNYLNQSNGLNHGLIDLDGNFFVPGNWTNNASSGNVFVNIEGSPDGTVHLTGNSSQTLAGSASTYFENLTINNSAVGNSVLLSQNQNIKGTLIFVDGIIGTNTNYVIVENTAINSITGHGTDKYINGNLRRYVSIGSYDFPVGSLVNYELINTNVTTQGSLNYLDAFFTAASPGTAPVGLQVDGTLIGGFLDYGYWTLTPNNGNSSTIDVTAVSRGHSNGAATASQHALFRRNNGGVWANFGTHNNATQSGTLTDPITAKRTSYASVVSSEYAIGRSDENALPIELLYFNAKCGQDSGVILSWGTSSEVNNDYFTLYRSKDGAEWNEVVQVKGAGNSNTVLEYTYTDNKATQHDTYFKLRQTDYDGKFKEFNLVYVYCRYNHKKFNLYPNPAVNYIVLEFYNEHHIEGDLLIDIFDSKGVLCNRSLSVSQPDFNSHYIKLPEKLISGTYFMQVKLAGEYFYSGKFIVKK